MDQSLNLTLEDFAEIDRELSNNKYMKIIITKNDSGIHFDIRKYRHKRIKKSIVR